MQEGVFVSVLFEVWFILRGFPSKFPALCQFYESGVKTLSDDQIRELAGLVKNQEVRFPLAM